MRFILEQDILHIVDVKEHKNRVKDRKLRQMKREYIKNHVSDFSDDEVDRLYDLLKG